MSNSKVFGLMMVFGVASGAAQAQQVSFEGSVTLTTDYIASGVSQTRGRPALQAMGYVYVPQGFYAGLFTSNVNYEPYDEEFYIDETDGDGNIVYEYEGEFYIDDPDALEFAPFIGYFYEFSNGISIDVGYEHYIYDYSGACCGVFYLGADASLLGDMVSVGALVKYDPDENNFDARATTMVYPVDMIGLRATLGYSESNDHYFANAGADYYFAQSWTLSADYHHATSDFTDDAAVAALSYRF